jgi:ribosome-binding factor A
MSRTDFISGIMANKRITRVNELLRREIAAYLYRLINEGDFDMSAVTITHVVTAPNLRHARVFVSIREHELERRAMLETIEQHRLAMQKHLNEALRLKYTPQLIFELDGSIEKGDRVLHLIAELEEKYGTDPESTDPEPQPESEWEPPSEDTPDRPV